MVNTISMQDMRHLNLFGKITRIDTRHSFPYNDAIVFAVPKELVSRAVGPNGRNIKKMSEILNRKIKVIAEPKGVENSEKFFQDIVDPVEFKGFEYNNDEIIINAGSQSKAALIGRNKRRLLELQKIAKGYFSRDLRIV